MLDMIKDNFAGRVTLFGLDCFFAFSDGYSLKIIPKTEEIEVLKGKCKEWGNNFDTLGWLYGVDNNGYDVAFGLYKQQSPVTCYEGALTFVVDIVQQTLNGEHYERKDLKGFTSIDFTGNAVAAIFNPKTAIDRENKDRHRIIWLPVEKYAKAYATELNGKRCNLIFTVIIDRQDLTIDNIDLGKMHSVIRLEFEERQDLLMIEPCWQAVCTLLSFCVGQYNVADLRVGLWDEKRKVNIAGFESPIYCRINNDKVKSVEVQHPAYYRFQADYLGDKMGRLFKVLNDKNTMPILSFLPKNNYDIFIDRNKIRDLCTALEVEYKYGEGVTPDPQVVSLVNALKSAVTKFRATNPRVFDDEERFYSYVFGALEHIRLPAATKLWHVYCKYSETIAKEIKWGAMTPFNCSETQTKKDIGWIVRIRNDITHSSEFTEAEIPNAIYARLRLAVYCSILERSGYPLEEIANIMNKYSGRLVAE
jgi:hypothetical protein